MLARRWFCAAAMSAVEPRVPLIKFVGKRARGPGPTKSVIAQQQAFTPATSQVAVGPTASKVIKVGTGVDFATLKGKAWFGRPTVSALEMEAVQSGGASGF